MSVSIDHRAANLRSLLAPVVILGVLLFLTFLVIKAPQTTNLADGDKEISTIPATQPLDGGRDFFYDEPIGMP